MNNLSRVNCFNTNSIVDDKAKGINTIYVLNYVIRDEVGNKFEKVLRKGEEVVGNFLQILCSYGVSFRTKLSKTSVLLFQD